MDLTIDYFAVLESTADPNCTTCLGLGWLPGFDFVDGGMFVNHDVLCLCNYLDPRACFAIEQIQRHQYAQAQLLPA